MKWYHQRSGIASINIVNDPGLDIDMPETTDVHLSNRALLKDPTQYMLGLSKERIAEMIQHSNFEVLYGDTLKMSNLKPHDIGRGS